MSTLAGTAYTAASVLSRIGFGRWAVRAVALLRGIGPYAAIEILLPGGSLFALLLWLYRRYKVATVRRAPLSPGIVPDNRTTTAGRWAW
jgi:hypothetical protein